MNKKIIKDLPTAQETSSLTSLGLFFFCSSSFSVVAVLLTWRLYRAHLGLFWFLVVPGCSRGRPRPHPCGGDGDGKGRSRRTRVDASRTRGGGCKRV
jgi:hypothetical protein